jgi:alpha-galactosidase/6-phospho-beta-glucosidase family protein
MKITFVGGGSLVWGRDLLTDVALTPPAHEMPEAGKQ